MPTLLRPVALVLLLLAGCATDPRGDAPEGLGEHRARWEAQRIESYRFDFAQQCFCAREQVQPVTIEVRSGRVARVVSRVSGAEVQTGPPLRWPTIPELFDRIAEAEREGMEPRVVRFDPGLGYPSHVEIGSLAADAGVVYTVSGLRPLD